jgi:hypothetical protein
MAVAVVVGITVNWERAQRPVPKIKSDIIIFFNLSND